jgi:hypothetical protein
MQDEDDIYKHGRMKQMQIILLYLSVSINDICRGKKSKKKRARERVRVE